MAQHTRDPDPSRRALNRRSFIALGAGTGTVLLAGCASTTDPATTDAGTTPAPSPNSSPETSSTDETEPTGTFRLLISDQPIAIDEFDSVDVTFDIARVFTQGADDHDGSDQTPTTEPTLTPKDTGTPTPTTTPTPTPTETPAPDEETELGHEGEGFVVLDLDGATVDLTEVVGDRAIGVFEGGLDAGTYTKIELYTTAIESVIDGEQVEVKLPSEKLQLTKPFEVVPDETVEFVFDITVVKRGNTGTYNLQPVIGESGVAGDDIEVEEVDSNENNGTETTSTESNTTDTDS